MTTMASQITSLTVVYSIVNAGVDQRKHQSSASLAFVRGIHRWPVNSTHKRPITRKMFPFDDVIMKYDTLLGQHLTAPVRRNTCVHCAIYHLLLSQDDLMGKHSCSLETFVGEHPIRDLNTEYRACSMATLSWAELSQVFTMTSHSQVMPSTCANSPRHTHRAAALGTGYRCHLATHGLGVLVNFRSFNEQYVVITKWQYAYLSIVHWCSMIIRQFGYACEIRIIRLSKPKWIFVNRTAILLNHKPMLMAYGNIDHWSILAEVMVRCLGHL